MSSSEAKRALIKKQLQKDPRTSNRAIAAALKTNDWMVRKVRRELEANAQIPVVTRTRGRDGRLHRRKRTSQATTTSEAPSILPFTQSRYSPKRRTYSTSPDSVLGQIRTACTAHPLAFLVALPFGGFVPLAVWCLAHLEVFDWWHWLMIAGGALFSSLTVVSWGETILSSFPRAVGFAVLVEGVMLTSQTQWLSISALSLLVIINATSCAVALANEENDPVWSRKGKG